MESKKGTCLIDQRHVHCATRFFYPVNVLTSPCTGIWMFGEYAHTLELDSGESAEVLLISSDLDPGVY